MSRSQENRDPERRPASKRAYYERNKERLRVKARESAYARYHGDDGARHKKYLRILAMRAVHEHSYRIRRLNQRRLSYLREHSVAAFRSNFVSRISSDVCASIAHGELLEDWDDNELERLIEAGEGAPAYGDNFEGD